jgi:hypothetical protein
MTRHATIFPRRTILSLESIKGDEMTQEQWRKTWIDTLIDAGIFIETAEDAFDVCYANQEIDLSVDPIDAANVFIPQLH